MKLNGSRAYYRPSPPKMPSGLVQLMEGMTREVLKQNPTDVYAFCAGHMKDLLEIRDGPTRLRSYTLEERIIEAQEVVRQRAQKRRQEYDKNILLIKQSDKTQLPYNEGDDSSPPIEKPELPKTLIPVHHEQELTKSTEIEISHGHSMLNEMIKDIPQNVYVSESETMSGSGEVIQSDVTENKDVVEEHINENNVNEVISHREGNNIEVNITSDNIPHEGNIQDKSSGNVEEQNIPENQIGNNREHTPEININEQITLNLSETKPDDPTDYGDIAKTTPVSSDPQEDLNLKHLDELEETKMNKLTTDSEHSLKDEDKLEKTISAVHGEERNSNTNNDENISVNKIDIGHDNSESSKIGDVPHDFNVNSSRVKSNDSILKSEEIDNAILETPLEDKAEVETDVQTVLPVTEKDDIPTLGTENEATEIPENIVKNAIVVNNEVTSPTQTVVNEESNSLIISIPGDEEILAHNEVKQNHINELCMTSSSVTDRDPESSITEEINHIIDIENSHNDREITINGHITTDNEKNDSSMDLETAAVTIQKVFRSFLFKSRASTFEDSVNDEGNSLEEDSDKKDESDFSTLTMERRPHGITRMDTVLQTVNEEKSLSLSTDDSSTLSSAATIIQAHVRGFLVRNKLNSHKTLSNNSFPASNSNDPSLTSLETDNEPQNHKTVLNIHIVPEGGVFLSRDESLITSMDLSLDGSPPSSINLHPLGHDKSERRKRLKREDAIQSISPPSNNSGKLSEDVDSVKEQLPVDNATAVERQVPESIMALIAADEEIAVANEKLILVDKGEIPEIISEKVTASDATYKIISETVAMRNENVQTVTVAGMDNTDKPDFACEIVPPIGDILEDCEKPAVKEKNMSTDVGGKGATEKSSVANKPPEVASEGNSEKSSIKMVTIVETNALDKTDKAGVTSENVTTSETGNIGKPAETREIDTTPLNNPSDIDKTENNLAVTETFTPSEVVSENIVQVVKTSLVHGIAAATVDINNTVVLSELQETVLKPTQGHQDGTEKITTEATIKQKRKSLTKMSSDESDVVTPFVACEENSKDSKLLHSGEFHDVVLPTRVSRSDTSVVREFKSVLVYFLLWNPT